MLPRALILKRLKRNFESKFSACPPLEKKTDGAMQIHSFILATAFREKASAIRTANTANTMQGIADITCKSMH
jgi:hypothetical protein